MNGRFGSKSQSSNSRERTPTHASDRATKAIIRKDGPATKLSQNAFFNFLRVFRKKHSGWTSTKIAIEGARKWCSLPKKDKDRFKGIPRKAPISKMRENCGKKMKRSCGRKRRKKSSCGRKRKSRSSCGRKKRRRRKKSSCGCPKKRRRRKSRGCKKKRRRRSRGCKKPKRSCRCI
ncbi:PREDICTED: protamine-like [Nicrophorus vespilloides]|uniref:Protamine-like n=1 Tax=Nicrophorus vespilloides TaxID=110193 RepID=A0ABM1MNF8_NICVS|nr:PREDICTED: protamine-like [Nicrophorus vespilloides]